MDNQGRSDYKYIWDLASNVMVKVSAIRPLTVLKKKEVGIDPCVWTVKLRSM